VHGTLLERGLCGHFSVDLALCSSLHIDLTRLAAMQPGVGADVPPMPVETQFATSRPQSLAQPDVEVLYPRGAGVGGKGGAAGGSGAGATESGGRGESSVAKAAYRAAKK
jgi:hypothetical protein